MYTVDEKDTVIELEGIPRCCAGAPCPAVFSEEWCTIVAYCLAAPVSRRFDDNAFVKFAGCYASMFGPPNEDAIAGHPLASRGLQPCGAYLVKNSSWVRQLERMYLAHPAHQSEHSEYPKHFILTFHDSTFECVAQSFTVGIVVGPLQFLLKEIDRFRMEPWAG